MFENYIVCSSTGEENDDADGGEVPELELPKALRERNNDDLHEDFFERRIITRKSRLLAIERLAQPSTRGFGGNVRNEASAFARVKGSVRNKMRTWTKNQWPN
jgi:hypothetical protein